MKKLLLLLPAALLNACGATLTIKSGTDRSESTVPLYVYEAGKDPAPTIILSPGCAGASPMAISRARDVRNWGYNVVLVDSHSGRGYGSVCEKTTLIHDNDRARDIVAAAEWATKQPWHSGKVGLFGYSAGANAGNFLAEREHGPVAAVVAFYPWCEVNDWEPKIPVQIHIGTADDWNPSYKCEYKRYRATRDVHVYEGATHSFDIPGPPRTLAGHQLMYDPKAAKAADDRSKAFFAKHLR